MSSFGNPESSAAWNEAAMLACRSPLAHIECPECHGQSLSAAWGLVDFQSREAIVNLHCASCKATKDLPVVLPTEAPAFFLPERVAMAGKAIEEHVASITARIRDHVKMPAVTFTTSPLWDKAHWSATTFRWHPTSEAPPVMGLVFDDATAGKQLFQELSQATRHTDEFEELRIAVIEGSLPGQRAGYTVHICPDPESLAARATVNDLVLDPTFLPLLGRWNRMYPVPGEPKMLPKFKMEFQKHREFLLAPAVRRQDGQLWFEPELGIVKTVIFFRSLSEITPDDPDAAALVLPQIITPPE